jgi:hypothetical protein
MFEHSPRAVPWEKQLPWARSTINQSAAAVPECDDLACAKAAGGGTSRDVGTSSIARMRNACGKFAVGRRLGGRPNGARPPRSKPGTHRLNACAASEPKLRPKRIRGQKLWRRVVTQQKFFFISFVRPAGVLRTHPKLGPQPGPLGERQVLFYPQFGSLGLMVMSYLGRAADRCSRAE